MSAKTPPTLLSGAHPNTPAKNRVMSSVCKSLATAEAKENTIKPKMGIKTEGLRP